MTNLLTSQELLAPTPQYRITANGLDITSVLQGRLISLRLTDNPGFEADTLELTLDDADGELEVPPRGAELTLALGWKGYKLVEKGAFVVTELEYEGPPDVLILRAHAADLRASLNFRRERSYHSQTLGDVVRLIGGQNRLTVLISAALDDIQLGHEDQAGETDASFLTRMAMLFDAIATVKKNTILFIAKGIGMTATGKTINAAVIQRSAGDTYRFALADRDNYTSVIANYQDNSTGKKGAVTVGEGSAIEQIDDTTPVGANGLKTLTHTYTTQAHARKAAQTEWSGMKKNKAELDIYKGVVAFWWTNKFKKQKSSVTVSDEPKKKTAAKTVITKAVNLKVLMNNHSNAAAARAAAKKEWDKISARSPDNKLYTGVQTFWMDPVAKMKHPVIYTGEMAKKENIQTEPSADNTKVLRHVYASEANAKRAATAEFKRLQRDRATFSMTLAQGRPELYPEVPITLQGFKPFINNNPWTVARVVHDLGDNGYTMQLELELRTEAAES